MPEDRACGLAAGLGLVGGVHEVDEGADGGVIRDAREEFRARFGCLREAFEGAGGIGMFKEIEELEHCDVELAADVVEGVGMGGVEGEEAVEERRGDWG